jgi:hypothetical protein
METFQRVRQDAYEFADVPASELPATTYIRQPPCHEPQKIEVQVYAVVPKTPKRPRWKPTLTPRRGRRPSC